MKSIREIHSSLEKLESQRHTDPSIFSFPELHNLLQQYSRQGMNDEQCQHAAAEFYYQKYGKPRRQSPVWVGSPEELARLTAEEKCRFTVFIVDNIPNSPDYDC